MTLLGDAFVRIRPDASGFEGEAKRGILGPMKTLAAAAAGAFAGAKIFDVLKDSIGAASDLNETVNKSNVIFGKNAKSIMDWSKNSAKSFGLSQAAALDYSANLGNMFQQLGFTGKAATESSKATVKLAADLGSFSNLDTGDVLERISGALRGEYDSLQLLIPNINAARVEQVAMAESGKKTASALTAQEKAHAVLSIVQKDGAAAQNDFAETSSGLANSQKILSAEWDNAKTRLGQGLLPVMAGAVGFLSTKMIPAFDGAVSGVTGLVNSIKNAHLGDIKLPALGVSSKDLIKGAKNVGSELFTAISTSIKTGDTRPITDTLAALTQDALDTAGGLLKSNNYAASILASVDSGIKTGNWQPLGKSLQTAILAALSGATDLATGVAAWVMVQIKKVPWFDLGTAAGKEVPTLLVGLATGILNFDLGSLLSGLADHWFEVLMGVLTIAFTPGRFIGKIGELLAKIPIAGKLLEWLLLGSKNLADGATTFIGNLFRGFYRGITDGGTGMKSAFGKMLDDVWTWVYVKGDDLLIWFKNLPGKMADALESGAEALGKWFRGTFTSLWDAAQRVAVLAIGGLVAYWLGAVGDILNAAVKMFGWVPGVGDKLKGAAADFAKFRDDVNERLGGIKDQDVNIVAKMRQDVLDQEAAPGFHGTVARSMGGSVFGKGSATSDSIPAMLSNGEHVWAAREVAAAGGHAAVAAMRRNVLHRAKGGPIGGDPGAPVRAGDEHGLYVRPAGLDPSVLASFAQTFVDAKAKSYFAEQQKNADKAASMGGGSVGNLLMHYLGTPYSWGGGNVNGPSRGFAQGAGYVGWDCSSFMQFGFWQALHKMIPRTAAAQQAAALPSGANPGSLVFYGRPAHHVAMILGGGKMIEEPHTGASARVTSFRPGTSYGIFDDGGVIPPGITSVYNKSGKPEAVLTNEEMRNYKALIANGGTGAGTTEVRVFLGDRELTDIVSTEVRRRTDAVGTSLNRGRR